MGAHTKGTKKVSNQTDRQTDNFSLKNRLSEEVFIDLDENGKINNGNYYRADVIAQLFGVSVRRIQQLSQDGVLKTTDTQSGRRYDLVPTIQMYVKYLQDKAYGRTPKAEKTIELQNQKLEAEVALKESQGELHRIKTQIVEGKYIPKEEVQLDYRRFFTVFKKFVQGIPSRVSGYINGVVEPTQVRMIESELNTEISNLLNGFTVAGITAAEDEEQKAAKAKKK